MPFKDERKMDKRQEFVLRAKAPGANRRELCRAAGITPRTGYKWIRRYEERGLPGLEELSRGPRRGQSPLRCSADVAVEVLAIRRADPILGPAKIRAILRRVFPADKVPSRRTIARVLERAGLSSPRQAKRRPPKSAPGHAPVVSVLGPNDLWTVDFKGWWRTKDGKRFEPLTVRDSYSHYALCLEVVEAPSIELVRRVFERLFADYGLPKAIQSDNGSPFASTASLAGLTQLSAWWVALGIEVVRSRVGCPQDNGAHERMHKDIAEVLERRPAGSRVEQQELCERWRQRFNEYIPHGKHDMNTPASVYRRSQKAYPLAPPEVVYPAHMERRRVTSCGTIRYAGHQRSVSQALAGYDVGVEYLGSHRFRVWFAGVHLGDGFLPWEAPLRPPQTEIDVLVPSRIEEQPSLIEEVQSKVTRRRAKRHVSEQTQGNTNQPQER